MSIIDYIIIDDVIDENTKSPDMETLKRIYAEFVKAGLVSEPIETHANYRLIDPDVQSTGSN